MIPSPTIFGHQVDWFQDLQYIAIGFSIIIFMLRYNFWKTNKIIYVFAFIGLIVFLGYAGGRIIEVIEALLINNAAAQQFSLLELLTTQGGTRWYGALLFNFIAFYLIIKLFNKKQLIGLIDEIVLAVSGGLIIGKIGCGLSGHGCYGIPTNLPWGMRFPYGSMPSYLPVHPTPIYDAIVYAFLFIGLIWVAKNKKFDGQLIIYFLLVSCIASILIEIIRTNEPVLFSMSLAQVIYFLLLIATLIYYKRTRLKI